MRRAVVILAVFLAVMATEGGARPAVAAGCASPVVFTPSDAPTIPSVIAGCPAGTEFNFSSGIYRMSGPIVPVSGDVLLGAGQSNRGTVLTGSRAIGDWSFTSGMWMHSGDTVANLPQGGICYSPDATVVTTCQYPDWIYRNGKELKRTLAPCVPATVTPGSFCIDYANNAMFLGSKPGTATIEYSWVPTAIVSNITVSNVTVRALQVRQYANSATGRAAVTAGTGWLVDHTSVVHTHACGIALNGESGTVVQHSTLSYNGQQGFCGGSTGATFTRNTVQGNNVLGFDASWEAGGGKFPNSHNLTVTNNVITENNGTGLWFDVGDTDVLATGNKVKNNNSGFGGGGDGIRFEVSCSADIRSNTVSGNERIGISIVNASHATVGALGKGNTVTNNGTGGIRVIATDRVGSNTCGSQNTAVSDLVQYNQVTLTPGTGVGIVNAGGVTSDDRFDANVYHTAGGCGAPVWTFWNGAQNEHDTFSQWQARSQDTTGSCS